MDSAVGALAEGDFENFLGAVRLYEQWLVHVGFVEGVSDRVADDLLWSERRERDVEDEAGWVAGVGIVVVVHELVLIQRAAEEVLSTGCCRG